MTKKLDDIEKKADFQVPEGYFEDLPLRIQKQIETEKPQSKSIRVPAWSYALAASVLLVMSFLFLFDGDQNTAEDMLAEVSEEDLTAYIEEMDLDAYDLATAFPESTDELEFDDVEMMEGLELEDQSIDDILLEYNLDEEDIEI